MAWRGNPRTEIPSIPRESRDARFFRKLKHTFRDHAPGSCAKTARQIELSLPLPRAGEAGARMNAIDFTAFVDRLALAAGETILPFFRTALTIEDKRKNGSFDPVTAADRAAESAMRSLIARNFPRSRHHRRGIRRGTRRCRICLGARSHRRHQILHLRHAGLGHADRASPASASRSSA